MKLWLLRHGQAETPGRLEDSLRALTDHGRREVAEVLAAAGLQVPGKVLVSPYLRAQQTASLLSHATSQETVDWITPDSDVRKALSNLQAYAEEEALLLVAHQPFLGDLAGVLIHGSRQEALAIPTAGLLALDGDLLAAGMNLQQRFHPQPARN